MLNCCNLVKIIGHRIMVPGEKLADLFHQEIPLKRMR